MKGSSSLIRVLLIENNPGDARLVRELFKESREPVELKVASRLSEGLNVLSEWEIDVILLDLNLPDSQGMETLSRTRTASHNLPVVVLTGWSDEKTGVEAVQMGAQDYLIKGQIDARILLRSIRYAMERQRLQSKLEDSLKENESKENSFRTLIERNADGIIIVDREGTVLFINPAAEALLNRKAEETIGEPFGFPVVKDGASEIGIIRRDQVVVSAEIRVAEIDWEGRQAYLTSLRDITERKQAEAERERLIHQLREALAKVKTLSGLIPICAHCKKIRDDQGYWKHVEEYVSKHSEAEFTHGMCPECTKIERQKYGLDKE